MAFDCNIIILSFCICGFVHWQIKSNQYSFALLRILKVWFDKISDTSVHNHYIINTCYDLIDFFHYSFKNTSCVGFKN